MRNFREDESAEKVNSPGLLVPRTYQHWTFLMYVPCTMYNLLFRPTNEQYINRNIYFVKYSDIFQCIYIIFRESFLICAKVIKSIKLTKQNVYTVDCYRLSTDYTS